METVGVLVNHLAVQGATWIYVKPASLRVYEILQQYTPHGRIADASFNDDTTVLEDTSQKEAISACVHTAECQSEAYYHGCIRQNGMATSTVLCECNQPKIKAFTSTAPVTSCSNCYYITRGR